MRYQFTFVEIAIMFLFIGLCEVHGQSAQNPSPMTESIRPHIRVSASSCEGARMNWKLEDKNIQMFIPGKGFTDSSVELIIHFHGLPDVTEYAICDKSDQVMVTVNGGSGGGSYERVFSGGANFNELLNNIKSKSGIEKFSKVTLSGWSAGYGAIRAIISQHAMLVDRVILLDGIHTSYVPEGVVLYRGGELDTLNLEPFLRFAELAILKKKDFLITHTSIFPGTFASTTECTEYLINSLGLKRVPVLKPGPIGTQQLGEVIAGHFMILSYAGNTAPDHVDHLHSLGFFLNLEFD